MADEPDSIQVPVVWVGADDLPVLFVNQFVVQVDPAGEVFITLGQLVPPAIQGATDEERRQQAMDVQYVPVKPIARIGLTPTRLQELKSVLELALQNHERQKEAFGDPRNG